MFGNSDASAHTTRDLLANSIITQPSDQRLPPEFLQILVMLDRQNRGAIKEVR